MDSDLNLICFYFLTHRIRTSKYLQWLGLGVIFLTLTKMCIERHFCVICLNIIQVSSLSCLYQYLWTPTSSSWSRPKRMPTFLEQGSSVCRRSGQDVKFAFWTEDMSVLTFSSKMFSGKISTSYCLCMSTVKSLSQLPMKLRTGYRPKGWCIREEQEVSYQRAQNKSKKKDMVRSE